MKKTENVTLTKTHTHARISWPKGTVLAVSPADAKWLLDNDIAKAAPANAKPDNVTQTEQ